jgi:transcriptional repressor NrdR
MRCPFCKEQRSDKVIDSRAAENGTVIRRRRECEACSKRFTTYERIEETTRLAVIKKDGRRVPYEREKLFSGIRRACWKRAISVETLNALVDSVEEDLFRNFDREVDSRYIGNAVASRLRKIDTVAYLRYASLYYEFQQVGDFIEEAKVILDQDKKDVPGQQELFHE